jgi:hypothetical protein
MASLLSMWIAIAPPLASQRHQIWTLHRKKYIVYLMFARRVYRGKRGWAVASPDFVPKSQKSRIAPSRIAPGCAFSLLVLWHFYENHAECHRTIWRKKKKKVTLSPSLRSKR